MRLKFFAFARPAVSALLLLTGCAIADGGFSNTPPPQAETADGSVAAPSGQALYSAHCLSCHQADGGGVPNMQPGILDSPWVIGDPKNLALFVMSGGFGSADRKESTADNVMPAFAHLSDAELALLLSYVRQAFGNGAGQVNASEVADARQNLPGSE